MSIGTGLSDSVRADPMLRWRKRLPALVFFVALIGVVVFGYLKVRQFGRELQRGWTPVADIARYEELLARVRKTGLAGHFPDVAPETTVGFNFTPGFLQGPMVLQLRCKVSRSELDSVIDLVAGLQAAAREAKRPADPTAPYPYDHTAKSGSIDKLASSFEVHILYAEDHGQNSFPWNHGSVEGMAVDRDNLIVLYFAEAW